MPSKVPQVATRLPPELRAKIDAQIVQARKRTGENLTISDWIRTAILEKLARGA